MILVDTIIDSILIESFKSALGAAAVLSIIIICIKPFIKKIENSLHVILFSMLMFILNGLIVLIMAYIIPGFEVYGGIFISAWYAILVGIVKNIIIRIIDIF
jgi:putative membrane protein